MTTQTLSPEVMAHDSEAGSRFEDLMKIIEHDFPLEFLIAGELAQFETFAIPSISRLLHRTALYEKEGVKRLDDTRATMYGIFTHAPDSSERETMVQHLNWVHGHYQISNDDYLYTLLRMFFLPIQWIQEFGWRPLREDEIEAMTSELVRIGTAMKIEFFSRDYNELYRWQEQYRTEHQRYDPANQAVAEGTIEAIAEHFPAWLRPLVSPLVRALLSDPDLLSAMGLKPAGMVTRLGVAGIKKTWHGVSKFYRPWRHQRFSQSAMMQTYPSYPNGRMDYCALGPKKLVQNRNNKGGCPFH